MSAVFGYQIGSNGGSGVILCAREFMNSLDESSMEEVKEAIRSVPWLADYYETGEKYIRSKDGRIKYVFSGLRHNLDSLKSKAKILIAWVDEADPVSDKAWIKLIPTVREDGSEIWVTWNPENEESSTKRRFIDQPPSNSVIVQLNWRDNPWFPDTLNEERLNDMKRDALLYQHIWEGECLTVTDAQIFAGRWRVDEFEPGETWDGPYYGLDFGFSQDPTAGVRAWCHEDRLYIEYEAGRRGLDIDDTLAYLADRIPEIEKHTVRADSARPESISFLQRNGMPRCIGVEKWAGSVEDGIAHLRGYREIVVHPRCVETARECRLYSYKINNAGDILRKPEDANNHYIDAIRYALQPLIGASLGREKMKKQNQKPKDRWANAFDKGGNSTWVL